jgi:nucleotide-binding universal stress UspA family protein
MSHVLAFGDDRSAEADRAWKWITGHRWAGWSLEIVSADPPADMHPVEAEEATLHPWEPDDPRDASGAGFDTVQHLRADVDPRVALISKPWDLIVIGPRGSGMLKSLHLGSTADWLLREPVSPLVVARQPGPVRKILVATDGSPHARRAIHTLASFPWLEDTGVTVVTVAERRVDADAALAEARETLAVTGADVETNVLEGGATHAIIEEIDDQQPDLIVMGARGHGRLRRMVVGSTAAAIAGSIDRSILVAHAVEGDD